MTKYVTLIDGGEIDYGCLNCKKRYYKYQPVCDRCGEPMENCEGEVWYFDRATRSWKEEE